jgi:predicted acylesterase/phospholipase RssA
MTRSTLLALTLLALVLLFLTACCAKPVVPPPTVLFEPVYVDEALLKPCALPEFSLVSTERDVAVYVSDVLAAYVDCSYRHQAVTTVLRSSLNQNPKP